MSKMKFLASAAGVAMMSALAQAQITFTTGTMDIAASWTGGDPTHPYEDPFAVWSNADTVNWTGTTTGFAFASMPLAIAAGVVSNTNVNPTEALMHMGSNYNWGFTDARSHDFTLACRQVQNFTLGEDWMYSASFADPYPNLLLGPFDTARIVKSDGTLTIDLLTMSLTGVLPAGNYQLETYLNQAWSSNIQRLGPDPLPAILADSLNVQLERVPAPGTVCVIAIGGVLACRRRRA